jgi:hypothetical protein
VIAVRKRGCWISKIKRMITCQLGRGIRISITNYLFCENDMGCNKAVGARDTDQYYKLMRNRMPVGAKGYGSVL